MTNSDQEWNLSFLDACISTAVDQVSSSTQIFCQGFELSPRVIFNEKWNYDAY